MKDSREGLQISNVHRIDAFGCSILSGHLTLHNISLQDSNKGHATSKEDIHHTVFSDWRNERLHPWLARIKMDGHEDLEARRDGTGA